MQKIYKYPWLIIAVIAVITVFFGFQLPKAELDNNNLRFVPFDDPALATSQWIDGQFGSSFFVLVGLQRPYGTIFEKEFIERIREYSDAVNEIRIVRTVTSIISADYITSIDDAIVAEKLIDDNFSGTREEIEELKSRLLSWDMYERALYSDDFTATQILIPLTISTTETNISEVEEYFKFFRDAAHEIFEGYADVYVTGMPIIMTTVNEAMNADLLLLIPVVIAVVLLILFFSFRRLTPVILPMLTVLVSVVWAIGAMPLVGIKLSVLSTVLPVILIAVGSAYGIHVVTHYLAGRKEGDNAVLSAEEHRALVLETVMKIRKPVFLAALTTFVSFVSFCFTKVAPCREFGYFASFGVAAAFLVAITLIPSLLIIRGPKKIKESADKPSHKDIFSAFLAESLTSIAGKKRTILFLALVAVAFSFYGLSKLIIDNVMIEYFRSDTEIFRSDVFIREQFGGSKVVSVVAHSDSPEKTLHPDTLAAMDGLSSYLQRNVPGVGKVMGFTNLVKRINQVFNANESPEGLRVTSSGSSQSGAFGFGSDDFGFGFGDSGADSFGFGFGDSGADSFGFGFGNAGYDDFGFGFSDSAYVDAPFQAISENAYGNYDGEKIYTQNEIISLFDRAAGSYGGMNANELVRELKRQVNYEGASYYEIPTDPARYGKETPEELQRIIANYLVLLAGNISEYANDPLEPTAVKSTIQLRTLGMDDSYEIFEEINRYVEFNFPKDVQVTIGGTTMVEDSINSLVVESQIVSMLFSIICVFIIISISNKSLIAGLMGITPLSITILLNFAVMGFSGIKLNLGTSMVAAVSVGVGIDYTIHCLEAYKRELYATGGKGNFLLKVFYSSGKAIVINALSVGAGFAVLLLSSFVMLGDLGLLVALTMFSSAFVSLTVLPAMLSFFKPKFIYKNIEEE